MSLRAIDALTDALEATKRLLLPFDRATWFRLAVVMFFVAGGGGLGFPGVPGGGGDGGAGTGPDAAPGGNGTAGNATANATAPSIEPTTELYAFLGAIVLVVVLFVLALAVVSAIMEFVYVESLASREVRLREPFRSSWRQGVRLFGFRISLSALVFGTALVAGLLTGLLLGGWPPTEWGAPAALGVVVVAVAVAVPLGLLQQVVVGFTNQFVVPIMHLESRGVLSAWRRFLPTLRSEPVEYLVYLVVSVVLGWGFNTVGSLVGLLAAIVLLFPFLVLGALPVLFAALLGPVGLAVVPLVLLYVIVLFVAGLLVQVPFRTYLRYYALLLLGDIDPELDLIPDLRSEIRADGGTEPEDDPETEHVSEDEPDDESSESANGGNGNGEYFGGGDESED